MAGELSAELSALVMVRLSRANPNVSVEIVGDSASREIALNGSPGAMHNPLRHLPSWPRIKEQTSLLRLRALSRLSDWMESEAPGTPEVAARVISHLARETKLSPARRRMGEPGVAFASRDDDRGPAVDESGIRGLHSDAPRSTLRGAKAHYHG